MSFAAVIRALLDTCATVKEAEERLADMPVGDHFQLMLVDATGDAAAYEFANQGGKPLCAVRRPANGALGAFNHYQSGEITSVFPRRLYFSRVRELAFDAFLSEHETVSFDDLKALVMTPMPNGLNFHAYEEGFGTLHALLCDATEKKLLCCMGSPRSNGWFEADLNAAPCMDRVKIPYENEPIDASYWNAC